MLSILSLVMSLRPYNQVGDEMLEDQAVWEEDDQPSSDEPSVDGVVSIKSRVAASPGSVWKALTEYESLREHAPEVGGGDAS